MKKMVKRWRLDEVLLEDLGVAAGIYVEKNTGGFYAYVPESPDGKLFESASKKELMVTVRAELKKFYELEWKEVIRVSYSDVWVYKKSLNGSRSGSSRPGSWKPNDPSTASEQVGPLMIDRLRIAVPPADAKSQELQFTSWDGRRTWSRRQNDLLLDYSDSLYDALLDFKKRIQELDHNIRKLLLREDLAQALLESSRSPLLLTGGLDEDHHE